MRDALRGLTVRGRAFLAAGVTSLGCAVVLGQPALGRIAVLLLALPLVAALVLARARYRLALVRTVEPPSVSAGEQAQVRLALSNDGRAPSGVIHLEDQVPYALGSRPRFLLDGAGPGWRRQVGYPVRSDVRGRHEIGPMTVRVTDPFGLVELGRAFRSTTPLVVTPRTVRLPTIPAIGGASASGDNRPRAFATGSAEDVTVREYRQGDDLRRVHWRSSARMGELMVRREEQPWQSRATVVLDNRVLAHRGRGAASSLETAVSAAASVALHLVDLGFSVRLVTAGGVASTVSRHRSDGGVAHLLEALAVLEADTRDHLDTGWLGEPGSAGLVVGVLGDVPAADADHLRQVRLRAGAALALVLDVGAWASGRPDAAAGDRTGALLDDAGWRVSRVGGAEDVVRAWAAFGRPQPVGAPASSPTATPTASPSARPSAGPTAPAVAG